MHNILPVEENITGPHSNPAWGKDPQINIHMFVSNMGIFICIFIHLSPSLSSTFIYVPTLSWDQSPCHPFPSFFSPSARRAVSQASLHSIIPFSFSLALPRQIPPCRAPVSGPCAPVPVSSPSVPLPSPSPALGAWAVLESDPPPALGAWAVLESDPPPALGAWAVLESDPPPPWLPRVEVYVYVVATLTGFVAAPSTAEEGPKCLSPPTHPSPPQHPCPGP